jgi:hypothetical protein
MLRPVMCVDPHEDDRAHTGLAAVMATTGPAAILAQPFYVGINDNFGDSQTQAAVALDA